MEYREVRELVRLRYELRHSFFGGDAERARTVLGELNALAARDPIERAALEPEMLRWRHRLGMD